jgi:type II secretion system protein H
MLMLPTGEYHPAAGFTLLEMLITLAIAGLMLLLVPTWGVFKSSGTRLRGEAHEVLGRLQTLRVDAMTTGVETGFRVGEKGDSYEVSDEKSVTYALPEGMNISFRNGPGGTAQPTDRSIHFLTDGRNSGGILNLSNGIQAVEVSADWVTGDLSIAD